MALFDFPSFVSTDGLNIQGDAAVAGASLLRLTPATNNKRGSVWIATPAYVKSGFVSDFRFRVTLGGGLGAGDGLAFVIQNSADDALGSLGGSMGYGGFPNSLAIEFDIFKNEDWDSGDLSFDEISVHSGGSGMNDANSAYILDDVDLADDPDMADGEIHHVNVTYTPGSLAISMDGVLKLTLAVVLEDLLDLAGGTSAWLGITAATGDAHARFDILSWSASWEGVTPLTATANPYCGDLDQLDATPVVGLGLYPGPATFPGPAVFPGAGSAIVSAAITTPTTLTGTAAT